MNFTRAPNSTSVHKDEMLLNVPSKLIAEQRWWKCCRLELALAKEETLVKQNRTSFLNGPNNKGRGPNGCHTEKNLDKLNQFPQCSSDFPSMEVLSKTFKRRPEEGPSPKVPVDIFNFLNPTVVHIPASFLNFEEERETWSGQKHTHNHSDGARHCCDDHSTAG